MKDNSLDGHRGKVAIGDSGINKQQQQQPASERGKTNSSSSSSVNRVNLSGGGSANAVASAATIASSASSEIASPAAGGQGATNFDDDYNEWELGIGDLIIDLDADIEKNNEKNSGVTQNGGLGSNGLGVGGGATSCLPSSGASGCVPGSSPSSVVTSPTTNNNTNSSSSSGAAVNSSTNAGLACSLSTTGQVSLSATDRGTMSNSKSSRLSGGIGSNANATNSGGSNNGGNSSGGNGSVVVGSVSGASSASSAAVEHQATVDKGLKMKIKRKNVGSKSSEAKHEIVQSDTSKSAVSLSSHHPGATDVAALNATVLNSTSTSTPANVVPAVVVNAVQTTNAEPKSKHSSGKGRSGSHRDKKEKSRDKDKNKSGAPGASAVNNSTINANSMDVNGVAGSSSNCNLATGGASAAGATAIKITTAGINVVNASNSLSNLTTQQTNANNPCLGVASQHNGAAALSVGPSPSAGIVISGAQSLVGGANASSNVNSHQETIGSVGVTNCGAGSALNGPASTMPPSGNVGSSIPNLTVKLEKYGSPSSSSGAVPAGLGVSVGGIANVTCPSANCSVISKNDELPKSPPLKRLKIDRVDRVDGVCSPIPPETQDTGTCTSIGTVTEPECLGPCEPGTSVLLEGIVWQETEGAGVLVVNVTWRGKTYVGTLLDCTKHDWAPPRLCESPISDMDAKTAKGRGKRGRGSANNNNENNFAETRTSVQSKLRNGKGRRNGNNTGFTVPNSPARSNASGVAESAGKRKGRPADLELSPTSSGNDKSGSKRSRTQSRNNPATPGNNNGNSGGNSVDFSQPSSPTLIECPEPNCSKKYKHINGLRYHQTHAHSGNQEATARSSEEPSVTTEECSKDTATANLESDENSLRTATTPVAVAVAVAAGSTGAGSVPPSPIQTAIGSMASPKANTSNALRNAQSTLAVDPVGTPITASSEVISESLDINSDLSTLATVAIGDSNAASNSARFPTSSSQGPTTQALTNCAEQQKSSASNPIISSTENPSVHVVATCGSVIQQVVTPAVIVSAGSTIVSQTPSVTVSIPTSHVMSFAGQLPSTVNLNAASGQSIGNAFSSHPGASAGPYSNNPTNAPTSEGAFSPVGSQSIPGGQLNPTVHVASSPLNLDKNKAKQDKMDRYKSQKLSSANAPSSGNLAVRPLPLPNVPITGSPTIQTITGNAQASSHMGAVNVPTAHPASSTGALMTASLKPIQPKPTILGEPTTINPALESLKKEKSKHKKKCKDKEKKTGIPSSNVAKIPGMGVPPNDAGDRVENLSTYHGGDGLHNAISGRDLGNLSVQGSNSQSAAAISGLCNMGGGTPSRSLDLTIDPNTPESTLNENVQSPAYSDISDANDTAPVLESEVAVSEKEKDDKTLKTTSEAAPSPSGNIPNYGMYYYGQPPYLIPSVPPQNASPPTGDKLKENTPKKVENERVKDPSKISWGSIDMTMESRSVEQQEPQNAPLTNKKNLSRSEDLSTLPQNSSTTATAAPGLPDYQQQQQSTRQSPLQQVQQPSLQQAYPYPYGYMQGFPYGMDPNFHVHMLANDPHYKQQQERLIHEQERMYKEQQHHQQQQQHSERRANHVSHGGSSAKEEERNQEGRSSSNRHGDGKRPTPPAHYNRERESSRESRDSSQSSSGGILMPNHVKRETPPASNYSSSSAAAAASLKEKQSENHQIMKENIELKSQMDSGKAKYSHYDANQAMVEKQREEIRRYYLLQDHFMEQQQKMDSESGLQAYHHGSHPSNRKEENPHYPSKHASVIEPRGPSCVSPHKSVDHHSKNLHGSGMVSNSKSGSSTSAGFRDSHHSNKEHGASKSKESSSSKNDSHHESGKEDSKSKSGDKMKSTLPPPHSEGQKPTMETTGPPPPPTNSYAYFNAAYMQPTPHFTHMPFDHPVYRGGLNPILMGAAGPAAAYGGSPYFNPQLRYHVPHGPPPPGPCDLPPPQAPGGPGDLHHHHMGSKIHQSSAGPPGNGPPGGTKALDLLHQVSQHYTTHSSHKIHELQERALMSPSTTPNSVSSGVAAERRDSTGGSNNPTPASPSGGAPITGSNAGTPGSTHTSGKGGVNSDTTSGNIKQDSTNAAGDRSRSPPPQRHLHTHHHTHVGVGYPIYDPYGVNSQHWKQAQAQRRVPFRLTQ